MCVCVCEWGGGGGHFFKLLILNINKWFCGMEVVLKKKKEHKDKNYLYLKNYKRWNDDTPQN